MGEAFSRSLACLNVADLFPSNDQLHDFPWEQTTEQLKQHISNKAW